MLNFIANFILFHSNIYLRFGNYNFNRLTFFLKDLKTKVWKSFLFLKKETFKMHSTDILIGRFQWRHELFYSMSLSFINEQILWSARKRKKGEDD